MERSLRGQPVRERDAVCPTGHSPAQQHPAVRLTGRGPRSKSPATKNQRRPERATQPQVGSVPVPGCREAGGDGWLADGPNGSTGTTRAWPCNEKLRLKAHRGSDMGWNSLGQGTEGSAAGEDGFRRRGRDGRKSDSVRRRTARRVRQSCARAAECIRISTEVMGGEGRPKRPAARSLPWLGLLLWVFACAALFMSLVMRAEDLDRDRRVATRSAASSQSSERAYTVPRLPRQAGEFSLFTTRPPVR